MLRWTLRAGAALLTLWSASTSLSAAEPSLTAQVDALFSAWDKPTSPGCAIAVMQGGKIVYEHGYGMADLDHDIPITPDTVFHVASVSKQFTAGSILLLAAEGKLNVDDPVRKYLPEVPDFGTPVTLRQLANHTSGMRDQWNLLQLAGWRYSLDLITDEDVMSVIARQKGLNFKPGSEYLYSNAGFTLLAQVVKKVSGKSIREFTTERIFTPLGMSRTHFRDDHAEIVKGMAYGYVPKNGTFALANTQFDTTGATSLLTTVRDLVKWDENFYAPKVGTAAIWAQAQQSAVLTSGAKTGYGFGLWAGDYRGQPFVYHSGSDAGYRADLIRFPKQHFSVAALCNLSTSAPGNLTRGIADIYLAKELRPKDADDVYIALADDQLAPTAGLYVNPNEDQPLRVYMDGHKLMATFSPAPDAKTYELKALGKNRFRPQGLPQILEMTAASGSAPAHIKVVFNDPVTVPQTFTQSAATGAFGLGGRALADFTGRYHSDEIDATYTVAVDGDHLTISTLKRHPTRLYPASVDLFDSDFAKMRFTRDKAGKVTGVVFNTGRIRNFPLIKINEMKIN
jgi:CubicO group peptidase (beta-lactamase class C family)